MIAVKMRKYLVAKIHGFLMLFWMISVAQAQPMQPQIPEGLTDQNGLGSMTTVFEPDLKIGKYKVSKTFQPACILTSRGTLLAFCQGRLFAGGDNDPKVILMNKSYNYGKSWQGVEVLSGPMNHFAISPFRTMSDGHERISFLTCVGLKVTKKLYQNDHDLIKENTGIDIRALGEDKAAVLCLYHSDDDGQTWKMEIMTGDRTPLYKTYDGYTLVFLNAIGQVHQIPEGTHAGRLIMAAPMYTAAPGDTLTDNFRNHACSGSGVIYSDDGGNTWQMDGMITDYLANEASAVSVTHGSALLMIRRLNRVIAKNNSKSMNLDKQGWRLAQKSYDGGASWSGPFLLPISDVRCHGTLARVGSRLYFSIPVGRKDRSAPVKNWDDDRVRGAIYFSDDEGITWKHKIIEEGYFSYSTIANLAAGYRITMYSRGGHGRFGIGSRVFTDRWLDSE